MQIKRFCPSAAQVSKHWNITTSEHGGIELLRLGVDFVT
jgi:hypothetical protein